MRADRFNLDYNLVFDKQIDSLGIFVVPAKHMAFVDYRTGHLPEYLVASLGQFPGKGGFVRFLFKSATKFRVDFNGGVDDFPR